MTEASLAIARKVILCAGLLVAALLFLFPHWRVTANVVHNENYYAARGLDFKPESLARRGA